MRVLFVSWAWPSHLLPLVPLAWAFRAAGHEVLVATQPPLVGAVTRAGLPAAPVGKGLEHHDLSAGALLPATAPVPRPHPPAARRRLGLSVRIAEDMADDLVALSASWRPALVLSEPTSYAAPLAAAAQNIPHASVLWGVDFHTAARAHEREAFADLCARFGVDGFTSRGLAQVDPCPASLQVPTDQPRLGLRHVPYNGSSVVPSWLLDSPDRPRICLSWGVSGEWAGATEQQRSFTAQLRLIEALATTDTEVVVAVAGLAPFGGVRLPPQVKLVERLPLHLLLPGCRLLISRGGAGSMMAALTAGVPQLCVPQYISDLMPAERLAAAGAALCLTGEPVESTAVREAVRRVLDDLSFTDAAARLRDEARAQPPAATVVRRLTELADDAAGRSAGAAVALPSAGR